MPEGPECTIEAKQLHSFSANKKLEKIEILTGRYTRKSPDGYENCCKRLPETVAGVSNEGKFIYLMTDEGSTIIITLGMSGTFKVQDN